MNHAETKVYIHDWVCKYLYKKYDGGVLNRKFFDGKPAGEIDYYVVIDNTLRIYEVKATTSDKLDTRKKQYRKAKKQLIHGYKLLDDLDDVYNKVELYTATVYSGRVKETLYKVIICNKENL